VALERVDGFVFGLLAGAHGGERQFKLRKPLNQPGNYPALLSAFMFELGDPVGVALGQCGPPVASLTKARHTL